MVVGWYVERGVVGECFVVLCWVVLGWVVLVWVTLVWVMSCWVVLFEFGSCWAGLLAGGGEKSLVEGCCTNTSPQQTQPNFPVSPACPSALWPVPAEAMRRAGSPGCVSPCKHQLLTGWFPHPHPRLHGFPVASTGAAALGNWDRKQKWFQGFAAASPLAPQRAPSWVTGCTGCTFLFLPHIWCSRELGKPRWKVQPEWAGRADSKGKETLCFSTVWVNSVFWQDLCTPRDACSAYLLSRSA